MQFSCESCKKTLQIGDEKVKGKRLVVRCKNCGARIQIADPALGPPPAGAAPLSSAPIATPAPAARSAPPPAARPAEKKRTGDSDTESTQAMDSGVLEQALRASKVDDSTLGDGLPQISGAQLRAPPPEPAQAPPPPAAPANRDPAIWFAMVAGKQTGPLTRAELGLKVGQSQVNPRTYLWKEGMAGWQRAQEVTELSSLFGPAPSKPPPPGKTVPPPVPVLDSGGRSSGKSSPGMAAAAPIDLASSTESTPLAGHLPIADERRGRQRQEPQFAKDSGGPDENSASGISLALDLDGPLNFGRQSPASKPAPTQPSTPKAIANNVTVTPSSKALANSLFPPEREVQRDPMIPAEADDDDDRTHVEPLPLGERVHQEAVANELFNSSTENSPVSVAAKDLASWASKELGRKLPNPANSPKAPVPTNPAMARPSATVLAGENGAAQASGAPVDPLAGVPEAPGFAAHQHVETTGNIIARSGVKKNRTGPLLLLAALVVAIIAILLYSLVRDTGPAPVAQSDQPQQQALGGTGESVSGLVQGKTSGAVAAPVPETAKVAQKKVAAAAPAPKPDEHALDAQALANLDNERGIGNHGPKADPIATPDTNKADSSLSADDIKKKLGENRGALQSCIEEAVRKEPNLRVGKIKIATTIAPSGTVTAAKIDKPTVDQSPLGACLKRATKRIVFPAFSGDAFEVEIPILVTASE